ncbi:uncharacterized protein V6R79_004168 [Siganus canaliculatus]
MSSDCYSSKHDDVVMFTEEEQLDNQQLNNQQLDNQQLDNQQPVSQFTVTCPVKSRRKNCPSQTFQLKHRLKLFFKFNCTT